MINRIWRALLDLIRRNRAEQEMDEELQSHLERQIEHNVAQGMDGKEARYAALRLFGGMEQLKEQCRDVRGVNFIETIIQDLQYGLRQLRRNPGFTIVAVATLALGIGVNTAIFSVVNAALLQPLPYRDPGRLVVVWNQLKRLGLNEFPASVADYYDYKSSNKVFEDIAAFQPAFLDLTGGGQPERVYGTRTSANLFPLLGGQRQARPHIRR